MANTRSYSRVRDMGDERVTYIYRGGKLRGAAHWDTGDDKKVGDSGTDVLNIYLSNSGGIGEGHTEDDAITPTQLATLTLVAGQKIYLNKGETFHNFTLNVPVDDVTIDSYGTGAKPILSGSTVILANEWSLAGGINSVAKAGVKWLYLDDIIVTNAKSNIIPAVSYPAANQIQVSAGNTTYLNTFSQLVGKEIRVIEDLNYQISYKYTITDYSAGVITLNRNCERMTGTNYFYIYNNDEFLVNETWSWDETTLKLKTAKTIADHVISLGLQDIGINITGNNCTVQNIEFKHYHQYGIKDDNGSSVLLSNTVHDCRGIGIFVTGNSWAGSINDNIVYNCNGHGISIGAVASGTILRNQVYNINVGTELGRPDDTNFSRYQGVGIQFDGDGTKAIIQPAHLTIQYNKVYNTGWDGIKGIGDYHNISYNEIYGFGQVFDDNAGISTFGNGSTITCKHLTVNQNIVHDPVKLAAWTSYIPSARCVGIYFDYASEDIDADGNIIYNGGTVGTQGIYFWDYATNIRVFNSIIVNYGLTSGGSLLATHGNLVTNLKIYDNIFYTTYQYLLWLYANNYGSGGYLDRNTYINPSYNNSLLVTGTAYTLANWRTQTSQDANSSTIALAGALPLIFDSKLITNPTNAQVTVSVPVGYKSIAGASTTSVILPAYSAQLLLREYAYAAMQDSFTGTVFDTNKWLVNNPLSKISQNNKLIIQNDHSVTDSSSYMCSLQSLVSGVAVIQADLTWTTDTNQNALSGVGLWNLGAAAVTGAVIYTRCGAAGYDKYRLIVYVGASTIYDLNTSATITKGKSVKIWTDGTYVKFYYWNVNTWTQMGATVTATLGYALSGLITVSDATTYTGANPVEIDNFVLNNADYATLLP